MLASAVVMVLATTVFPQDTSASVERSVQAAVIDSLFVRDTTRRVVVADSTISGGSHFVDEDYQSALRMLGKLPAGLQADFQAVRVKRRAIDSLPTKVPLVRLDAAARAKLRESKDPRAYWMAFYRQFPGTPGQIALSRPGFSRDGRAALILVEYGCGRLCGGTLYALLERQAGRWRVTRVAQPRIS